MNFITKALRVGNDVEATVRQEDLEHRVPKTCASPKSLRLSKFEEEASEDRTAVTEQLKGPARESGRRRLIGALTAAPNTCREIAIARRDPALTEDAHAEAPTREERGREERAEPRAEDDNIEMLASHSRSGRLARACRSEAADGTRNVAKRDHLSKVGGGV